MNTDTFTARVAAIGLVVAGLGALCAIAVLAVQQKSVPSVLPEIALAAFGILAPSPVAKTQGTSHVLNAQHVTMTPETLGTVLGTPAAPKRRTGQKGEVGCLGLLVGVAVFFVVALVVWAIVS